jgi:hypothetical protein
MLYWHGVLVTERAYSGIPYRYSCLWCWPRDEHRHAVLYAKPAEATDAASRCSGRVGRVTKLLQYCFGEKGPVWKKRGRKARSGAIARDQCRNAGKQIMTVIKTVFSECNYVKNSCTAIPAQKRQERNP